MFKVSPKHLGSFCLGLGKAHPASPLPRRNGQSQHDSRWGTVLAFLETKHSMADFWVSFVRSGSGDTPSRVVTPPRALTLFILWFLSLCIQW